MHNLDLPQNLTQHILWKIVHFTPKFNLFLGENLPMLCVGEMVALHDWSEVCLRLVGLVWFPNPLAFDFSSQTDPAKCKPPSANGLNWMKFSENSLNLVQKVFPKGRVRAF